MYCINCGVKLADSEKKCPLCGTVVFHPELVRDSSEDLYPREKYPAEEKRSFFPQVLLTALFLLPMLVVLICDLQYSPAVTWSGFVIGALVVGYVWCILPTWFRDPNPVIFVPCSFAAIGLYLLYIDLATAGGWFLPFAFPVTGCITLIVTAVVALMRYLPRGRFYIFGGAVIALGGFMPVLELLLSLTFEDTAFVGWSFHPLVALGLLGGLLIFVGAYRPAREALERKFFI